MKLNLTPSDNQLDFKYKNIAACVLAAGKGTRMKTEFPKVLHEIQGRPLILYPLTTLRRLGFRQIITVLKHHKELIIPIIDGVSEYVVQGDRYGTAKALEAALKNINEQIEHIMVVNGDDSMFYSHETFEKLIDKHLETQSTVTFITLFRNDPTGLGRIIYDDKGKFKKIVEEKDANENIKEIREVNAGVYLFKKEFVSKYLPTIKPSQVTGEYYLTDLLQYAVRNEEKVTTFCLDTYEEFFGVNSQQDLREARLMYQRKQGLEPLRP